MRILAVLAMLLIYSAAFAQSFYYLDYRFIDPKEFDKAKAAPHSNGKLTGKEAQDALKEIAEFNEEGMMLSIYDNIFDDMETWLIWYYPEQGLALLGQEYYSLFDVKNKIWLDVYDPSCTKTSPDGNKRIVCASDYDKIVHSYYEEKEDGQYVRKQYLRGELHITDYYWIDNDSIKCLKEVEVEGDDIFLPVLARFTPIRTIDVNTVPLEDGKYDKTKVKQYQMLDKDAEELKGLVSYKGEFIKSLKTRSGKELVVVPEITFAAYYPELDIIRLEFYRNMYLYYTYNLTTGETYDTIGNPSTWAISPDGKHRINYIENLYWLEEKGKDGLYHKLARLKINGLMNDYYWLDNKTIYFTHSTTANGKWTHTPMSAVLLQ